VEEASFIRSRPRYFSSGNIQFGNLAPRDISSRAAKEVCDEGRGSARRNWACILDFTEAIKRLSGRGDPRTLWESVRHVRKDRPGKTAYERRCAFYSGCALYDWGVPGWLHWVSHNDGPAVLLFSAKLIFSDHGANRLGASER